MKMTISGLGSVVVGAALFVAPVIALADTVTVNFENPPYTLGNINGQDGWLKTGAYDVAVTATGIPAGFGTQSLRTSDAVTSGGFGDQTFAKPLVNAVGEVDSTNGAFLPGTLQRHFEMQFDLASVLPTLQPGMHVSVSPDRGDGSRMSYLRFEDQADGIHIFFDDVQGVNPGFQTSNFVETEIATTSRTPHTIKLTMDLLDGPSNDVVKVYVDGVLKITGTSWENYYRFDTEAAAEQSPRIVKTVLFRESGAANLADAGNGFLIDNYSASSGPILVGPPTNKDQCKNNGWKTFNNPSFRNQGDCVSYIEHHNGKGNDDDKDHEGDNDHGDDNHGDNHGDDNSGYGNNGHGNNNQHGQHD